MFYLLLSAVLQLSLWKLRVGFQWVLTAKLFSELVTCTGTKTCRAPPIIPNSSSLAALASAVETKEPLFHLAALIDVQRLHSESPQTPQDTCQQSVPV